ncbi:MAG: DNA-binding response regulator [Nitrospirales bacterium]|nr:MAG: DNA-binding response regulator [Nitrospirales bacterium]
MTIDKRGRIFLVDDHILVLESCKSLLEPYHDVVGLAQETTHLVSQVQEKKPDLMLLDISMPDGNGYDIARSLKKAFPSLKIIFVSMHLEPTYVMEAFRSGGDGYIPKQTAGNELLAAIQDVLSHKRYISPLISGEVRDQILARNDGMPGTELSGRLTERQEEVLKLVAQGLSSKDIADLLMISLSTVAYHKTQIIQALGLKTKADLTKYAIMKGIVSPSS